MLHGRRPWQEELEIIDRTMKAISSIADPEALVEAYWDGIGELLPVGDFVALSRRNVEAPYYLVTRSSRFTEHFNPWTQRDRLPRLTGGLLGEIAYAGKPVIIDDVPDRLSPDDPGHFYLQGFQSLIALPQYDGGQALNVTTMLLPPGMEIDKAVIPIIHWQSGLFGRGTQNLVLKNQLSAALANLDRELQVVGEIQKSLLPSELPVIPGFEIAASYQTSARAGGDYYDFFPLHDGGWGLFIADVSGHGTPAAVLMAITHAIAHAKPRTHTPPSVLLQYVNDRLAEAYTRDGTFVTAFYAVLDPAKRTLTFSAAGHNPPRLLRDGKIRALDEACSLPLGILAGLTYEQATVELKPGDLLALYTDGITEAMAPLRTGEQISLLGVEGLDQVLTQSAGQSAQAVIDSVQAAVAAFSENRPPTDDRTLIALRAR
jgi:sigma-B regulation protein RsbU (phosphoserine phosphatase)